MARLRAEVPNIPAALEWPPFSDPRSGVVLVEVDRDAAHEPCLAEPASPTAGSVIADAGW